MKVKCPEISPDSSEDDEENNNEMLVQPEDVPDYPSNSEDEEEYDYDYYNDVVKSCH